MKMMDGAAARAWANRSRTRAGPTPTSIPRNSDAAMEKNGTPASPATALASSVLPLPGGPDSRMPLGGLAPKASNISGSARNSLTSRSSSMASCIPATSAKVTAGSEPAA